MGLSEPSWVYQSRQKSVRAVRGLSEPSGSVREVGGLSETSAVCQRRRRSVKAVMGM